MRWIRGAFYFMRDSFTLNKTVSDFSGRPQSAFADFLMNVSTYGSRQGKTVIGKDPFAWFISKNGSVEIHGVDFQPLTSESIGALKELYYRIKHLREPGSWIAAGYFGFDLCRQLENIASNAIDDLLTHDIFVAFYDNFSVVQEGDGLAENLVADFHTKVKTGELKNNFTKQKYLKAVSAAREYIHSGDIFQVNLSQRFETPCDANGLDIYNRLQLLSPAPYSGYLDCGTFQIASSSPESFISLNNGLARTRPIKGTRRRSGNKLEDISLADELLASAKDRAENVMIVDVERNDLSRVCDPGSVQTEELCGLESFSNVHHLVSTVNGKLTSGKDIFDLLEAAFPSGSISGAPKIRSMEIIYELEKLYRGPYTGSMGYIDSSGNAEFNILIRTIFLKDGKAYFQAGGGIVADSDPVLEYEETLYKASRMFQALGMDIDETFCL